MANEILIFDAAASNPDGTNPGTALELGPADDLRVREAAFPAPQQTVQWSGSVDTEGSLPASRKHENRAISLTVLCITAASLRSLQDKVAKVGREGGTLKWILPNAETVIFDLHSSETFQPRIDKLFYVRSGAFCEVQVTLLAKPYGRGASVTLSSHSPSAKQPTIFTETGITGDVPGLGYLRVTNATTTKTRLIWGQRSRYYDATSTAGLFFEAETSGTVDAGAAAVGPAGASGGGANKVISQNLSLAMTRGFYIAGLSHVGSYRVLARIQADTANTGITSLQLKWVPGGTQASNRQIENAIIDLPVTYKGGWYIADFGMVSIPDTRLGAQTWTASFWNMSTVNNDDVHYDWVALVPANEGYGQLRTDDDAIGITTYPITSAGAVEISPTDALYRKDATVWGAPKIYEGDYLLIPPAGAEARTLQMFVILTGDDGDVNLPDEFAEATNLETGVASVLTYIPRYLVVPSP
jgi:hypothetical protein